eukprot:Platyproteum_vivax@DN6204_c0_g1_i1.p1
MDIRQASIAVRLAWIAASVAVLLSVVWPPAAYWSKHGKLRGAKTQGFLDHWVISKTRFTDFYTFGFLWNAAIIVFLLCWKGAFQYEQRPLLLAVTGLFQVQLLRRLLEQLCFFPVSTSHIHVFAYTVGMGYYFLVSITLVVASAHASPVSPVSFVATFALVLFVACSLFQWSVHRVLGSLKKKDEKYPLPCTWHFSYSSTPHYLAEMGVYTSLLFLLPTVEWLLVLVFVVSNLSVSGVRQHRWYKEVYGSKIGNRHKYAVIPGVI